MKKYLVLLVAVCMLFSGCGTTKDVNKAKNDSQSKIESNNSIGENKTTPGIDNSSSLADNDDVDDSKNINDENSEDKSPYVGDGEEIILDFDLDDIESSDSVSTDSKTYSMISSSNVMGDDGTHGDAIPPTLELKNDNTFILSYSSTENITGNYNKTDSKITCTDDNGNYVFTDNNDGTLSYVGNESSELIYTNENEYKISDNSLFFSN